ncbi:hypothetical protein CN918_25775 [Priestia megaterium]|nr:hypothetical protein CN918_25775 [Priestia megaterium]
MNTKESSFQEETYSEEFYRTCILLGATPIFTLLIFGAFQLPSYIAFVQVNPVLSVLNGILVMVLWTLGTLAMMWLYKSDMTAKEFDRRSDALLVFSLLTTVPCTLFVMFPSLITALSDFFYFLAGIFPNFL